MQNPEEEKVEIGEQPNGMGNIPNFDDVEEKPKSAGGWKALLTPALISIIITFVMFQFFFAPNMVTKSDATTNFENITKTIGEIQEKQSQISSALTSKADSSQVANISQQISNIENRLNDLPSDASIRSMSDEITSEVTSVINSKLGEFSSTIDSIKKDVEALQEEEESSSSSSSDDLDEVEFNNRYSRTIVYPANELFYETGLSFDIENNLSYDIEDVEIEVVAHSRGVPIEFSSSNSKVTGGWPLDWQKVHVSTGIFVVKGYTPSYGSGLEIRSDRDESVFLTLTLYTTSAPTEDVTLYIEGRVTSFDKVE